SGALGAAVNELRNQEQRQGGRARTTDQILGREVLPQALAKLGQSYLRSPGIAQAISSNLRVQKGLTAEEILPDIHPHTWDPEVRGNSERPSYLAKLIVDKEYEILPDADD